MQGMSWMTAIMWSTLVASIHNIYGKANHIYYELLLVAICLTSSQRLPEVDATTSHKTIQCYLTPSVINHAQECFKTQDETS